VLPGTIKRRLETPFRLVEPPAITALGIVETGHRRLFLILYICNILLSISGYDCVMITDKPHGLFLDITNDSAAIYPVDET